MGADLYIKNMDRDSQIRGFEVSEDARQSGYFRDCYNHFGLFSTINACMKLDDDKCMSWWRLVDRKDLGFKTDEESDTILDVEGLRKLRSELEPTIVGFVKFLGNSRNKPTHRVLDGKDEATGEYKFVPVPFKKGERKEYKEWAAGLLKMIDLAIKIESPIIFSV